MRTCQWSNLGTVSEYLLAEGLEQLRAQRRLRHDGAFSEAPGNYLIGLAETDVYAGEAERLSARLRQQLRPRTSTFYKNYTKQAALRRQPPSSIEHFHVRAMPCHIGRKELEEFSIVNASCGLNRFQLGKRSQFRGCPSKGEWDAVQSAAAILLAAGVHEVERAKPVRWKDASVPNLPGVYVVFRPPSDEVMYIGESSDIHERYRTHGEQTYFSAFRRHVGTEILGFELQVRNNKPRYFSTDEDDAVSRFIHDCRCAFVPVSFGRFELEKGLIKKHSPELNRKDRTD